MCHEIKTVAYTSTTHDSYIWKWLTLFQSFPCFSLRCAFRLGRRWVSTLMLLFLLSISEGYIYQAMDRRLLASAGPGNPLINWYRIQMDCCPLWIVYKLGTICWTLSLFTLILYFYIFSVCLHFASFLFIRFPAVKPPFFSLETSFSVQCKSKDRDRCEWWHPNISELCCARERRRRPVFSSSSSSIWSK